jgi:hypothetical protein
VIGHSVDSGTREKIISEIRRICPSCLICFVYEGPPIHREPLADVCLDVTAGPEPLVTFLQDRLPERQASAEA